MFCGCSTKRQRMRHRALKHPHDAAHLSVLVGCVRHSDRCSTKTYAARGHSHDHEHLRGCGHCSRVGSAFQGGRVGDSETAVICDDLIVGKGFRIWRRGWDLNPRYPLRYVRFRGGSFQPLTHLSASKQWPVTSDQRLANFYLRLRKNVCSSSAQRPARTPPLTSMQWFSFGWFSTCMTECAAPALGSSAP